MALYPPGHDEPRSLCRSASARLGSDFPRRWLRAESADLVADSVVFADRRGNHSHGSLHVPDYVRKLVRGVVNPHGAPRLLASSGPVLRVDADNAMGQIGMEFAMKETVSRAADVGVAFAAVGGSNHCGALNYFSIVAAREGMIGVCGTNAIPTMARERRTRTCCRLNPISIAIPGDHSNFLLDTTFGEAAYGKIRVYQQKGHPIPPGWVLNSEGEATTDPNAAFEGLIQSIGGHKEVGLGMAIGMLSTLLSGAAYGTELRRYRSRRRSRPRWSFLPGHQHSGFSTTQFSAITS